MGLAECEELEVESIDGSVQCGPGPVALALHQCGPGSVALSLHQCGPGPEALSRHQFVAGLGVQGDMGGVELACVGEDLTAAELPHPPEAATQDLHQTGLRCSSRVRVEGEVGPATSFGLVTLAPQIFDLGAGDRDGVDVSEVGAEDARDVPDVPDAQAVRDLDAVLGKAATWTRTLLQERREGRYDRLPQLLNEAAALTRRFAACLEAEGAGVLPESLDAPTGAKVDKAQLSDAVNGLQDSGLRLDMGVQSAQTTAE